MRFQKMKFFLPKMSPKIMQLIPNAYGQAWRGHLADRCKNGFHDSEYAARMSKKTESGGRLMMCVRQVRGMLVQHACQGGAHRRQVFYEV